MLACVVVALFVFATLGLFASLLWGARRRLKQTRATLGTQVIALQTRETELRELLRAKDEFMAVLGHELRNPLGAITSAVALLNRIGNQRDGAVAAHDIIARQTAHLARLVDDLLDLARVTSGKIALDRIPIDLAVIAERAVSMLRAIGHTERHVVTVETRPAWIDADVTRIEQVVSNLLTNALKYTPAGGAIRVVVGPDGNDAVLQVVDSGVGMSSHTLRRVFDLFVQGDQGPDRSQSGLGIGLALVQRLVAMHGGSVVAASDGVGRGSVLVVRLPRIAPHRVTAGTPSAQPRTALPRRVLIVEDDRDARSMLRHLLELEGHKVSEAEDGAAAIELARTERPEVVLIDIGLPRFDGYELARRLRAVLKGRVTLIAQTGYGQRQDRERARDAGFDRHFTKPVDPRSLAEAVAASAGMTLPSVDDRLATAAALTRLVASGGDLRKTCDAIAEATVNLLGARVARVWRNDATARTLTACGSFGVDPETTVELLEATVIAHGSGVPGHVLHARTPLYISDASDDPRWVNRRFIREVGVHGYAGLPLMVGDHLWGVLSVMFRDVRDFRDEEKALLQLLADQAALALQSTPSGPRQGEHRA
jgi:signal transduction histidine kinase/DNA-binding NarL/FixJ family response regulator